MGILKRAALARCLQAHLTHRTPKEKGRRRPAALFIATKARLYARVPEKGNEPNAPAFTLPEILSPSTVPLCSSVIGIGEVIEIDQETLLPSALPFAISIEPCWPACVPVNALPLALRSSVAFCGPIGELIVIFHLPSTDMRRSSLAEGVHLRVPHACAQAFGDDNVTESLG